MSDTNVAGPTRRGFLKTSAAVGAAGLVQALGARAYAAENNTLRVGLVGCGGRGSGAAVNALSADPHTQLVALGDLFADHAQSCRQRLSANAQIGARVKVDDAHVYSGFDCYKHVIDNCDVVLLCEPPGFRPPHLQYAVSKGKHVFAEKPVAVDPAGIKRVLAACEEAKKKNLSVVSGLCYRYQHAKRETFKRIHGGDIGDIVAMECHYQTNALWHRGRKPEWSEMEYQVRNWLYFTWLSGDHICEQHVHSIDKCAWAMQDQPPISARATGGRTVRTEDIYGDVWDHFYTLFEYPNGVNLHSSCRQWLGCDGLVNDYIVGTRGRVDVQNHRITGEKEWRHRVQRGDIDNMYQNEHDELFAAIRKNQPINNGDYMCKSSMMGVMGRISAYTGKVVTWKQMMESDLDLSPKACDWNSAPEIKLPIPGRS